VILSNFTAWLKQPFETGMPVWRWFAFVGLLIVILAAWRSILMNLENA
jgi:hypothetical protein